MSQCQRCYETVQEASTACPHCGYAPGENGRIARAICLIAGCLLTATVVGAVIGLPLIALAIYGHKKGKGMTPANTPV